MTKEEQKDTVKKIFEALLKFPLIGENALGMVQILDLLQKLHSSLEEPDAT